MNVIDSVFMKTYERYYMPYEKDVWHAQKRDLAKKFCFEVSMGNLRSFRGYLEVIW